MICKNIGATLISLSLIACGNSADYSDQRIAIAETFVDAFYSFDPEALRRTLLSAEDSIPSILFYQGWAEGGNYKVIERMPCAVDRDGTISCSITVKDDLIGALGIGINVTDTFHLTFADGRIMSVTNSSNDPQTYHDAKKWVQENRSELIDEPCKGFFDGGPTPGDCVRAMVSGYSEFVSSGGDAEGLVTNEEPVDVTELTNFATRYAAAWSSQDPAAFALFYADDGSLRINNGEPSVGREAVEQTARDFMTAFPDMVVSLVDVRQEGSYINFHWHWTGTNTGPDGTGNAVDLRGYEQWTFDGEGLILESLGHLDDVEYQRQLIGGTNHNEL